MNRDDTATQAVNVTNISSVVMISVKAVDENATDVQLTTLVRFGEKPTSDQFDLQMTTTTNKSWLKPGNGTMVARLTDDNTLLFSKPPSMKSDRRSSLLFVSVSFQGEKPLPLILSNDYTYDTVEVQRPWNVSVRISLPECKFWNEKMKKFDSEGCTVS